MYIHFLTCCVFFWVVEGSADRTFVSVTWKHQNKKNKRKTHASYLPPYFLFHLSKAIEGRMIAAIQLKEMRFEPEKQSASRFQFLPVIHRHANGGMLKQNEHRISDIISAVELTPRTDDEGSADSQHAERSQYRKKIRRARAKEVTEHALARARAPAAEPVDAVVLGIDMAVKNLRDGQLKVRRKRQLSKEEADRRAAELEEQRSTLRNQLESTITLRREAQEIKQLFAHPVVPISSDGGGDSDHMSSPPSASIRRAVRPAQPSHSARSTVPRQLNDDSAQPTQCRANSETSAERDKMQEVFKTLRQPLTVVSSSHDDGKVHASNVMEAVREVQRRRREREYHLMLEAQVTKDFEDAERFRRFEERAAASRMQALENMLKRETRERALQEAVARADAERRQQAEGRIIEKERLLQARLAQKNIVADRRKLVGITFTAV